tara:strand:+ start:467 stop:673 length:207 start_codon:yes stop_codon:yes gene_type:complete
MGNKNMNKKYKLKSSKILEVSKIVENFIDKHKTLEHVGSGLLMDKVPERDVEIRYKNKDYLLTIREVV